MSLTAQQLVEKHRIALTHVCYLAGQTVHPQYATIWNRHISTVLTVNAGYE